MPLLNKSGVYGSSPPASDRRLPRGYAYGYKISIYIRILLIWLLLWFGNAVHLAIPVSASPRNFPSRRYPSSSLFDSYCWWNRVLLQAPDNPGNNTGSPCRSAGYSPQLTAYAAQWLTVWFLWLETLKSLKRNPNFFLQDSFIFKQFAEKFRFSTMPTTTESRSFPSYENIIELTLSTHRDIIWVDKVNSYRGR